MGMDEMDNKIFIISDLHGSLLYTKKALDFYQREGANYIVLLGDQLYHGPRNPLPLEYNPKEVASLLNKHKNYIIAVRGNCDSEVDQMLLEYPIMSDYSIILYNKYRLFITHGHLYNNENIPNFLDKGDVLIYGHTHIFNAEKKGDVILINPGSVSLPKENKPNTYCILYKNTFTIKDLEGNIMDQYVI